MASYPLIERAAKQASIIVQDAVLAHIRQSSLVLEAWTTICEKAGVPPIYKDGKPVLNVSNFDQRYYYTVQQFKQFELAQGAFCQAQDACMAGQHLYQTTDQIDGSIIYHADAERKVRLETWAVELAQDLIDARDENAHALGEKAGQEAAARIRNSKDHVLAELSGASNHAFEDIVLQTVGKHLAHDKPLTHRELQAVRKGCSEPINDAVAMLMAADVKGQTPAPTPSPPPVPTFEQLEWKLEGGAVQGTDGAGLPMPGPPPAACREVYNAAVAAGTLLVRTEEEARMLEGTLTDTIPSIKREAKRAEAKGPIAWHKTNYTSAKLQAKGFRYITTPTISCVYHPAVDGKAEWWEVRHVYVPTGVMDDSMANLLPALLASRDALHDAVNVRFEEANGTSKLKDPKNLQGETFVDERGDKTMEGPMLMHGSRCRRARSEGEKVKGCAHHWPSRYNPNGQPEDKSEAHRAAADAVRAHSTAFTQLEAQAAPEGAQTRRSIANRADPAAKFRVIEGDVNSTAFAMALTHGYVVDPHNDSGKGLETVAFVYPSHTPLPDGHEWCFTVSGCVHPLPTDPRGFALIAMRGEGVGHGTLPTASSLPHLTHHSGVGSALVTKADMVDVLLKQQEEGALPTPTEEQLVARREAVKQGGALLKATEQRDAANKAFSSAVDAAVGDAAVGDEQIAAALDQQGDAGMDQVIQAGGTRKRLREQQDGLELEPLVPQSSWQEAMLQTIARGGMPTTDVELAPRSVRNDATKKAGSVIVATTDAAWRALGVPDGSGPRSHAAKKLYKLMHHVPAGDQRLFGCLSVKRNGTKSNWYVLTPAGFTALATAARETTIAQLNSEVRYTEEATKKKVRGELLGCGFSECPTCFMPILNPDDPQYREKDAMCTAIIAGDLHRCDVLCECRGQRFTVEDRQAASSNAAVELEDEGSEEKGSEEESSEEESSEEESSEEEGSEEEGSEEED
ncbi:hypothetical protein OAO87_00330 [bacterium]|nr:hypothetical protein [bacterium]